MKKIKTILLSTVCFVAYADGVSHASYDVSFSFPGSGIGIHTYHTKYTIDTPLLSSLQKKSLPHYFENMPRTSRWERNPLLAPDPQSHSQSDAEDDIDECFDSYPLENSNRTKSGGQFTSGWEDNKLNGVKLASVCFITDAGNCIGNKFGNVEKPGSGSGNPGGGSSNDPEYETQAEQCANSGYITGFCPPNMEPEDYCPADSFYYKRCVCSGNLVECVKPYYGVGTPCDGKYASCARDDDKACREDGYSQTAACSSTQTRSQECPYSSVYYDKCVCRSDLVTCTYPQTGVGTACDGKYASCQCPSSYQTCDCGGATGATACTVNGTTTYSSCKECCSPLPSETGCVYGSTTESDGCGGTRTVCLSEPCANSCSLESCPENYICSLEACSGKYCKTGCVSGYTWSASSQTCSQCSASYKYDETTCPISTHYHCSTATCDGKYTDCYERTFTGERINIGDFIFVPWENVNDCPGIKRFTNISIRNGSAGSSTTIFGQCIDTNVDQACYDLSVQLDTNYVKGKVFDITQDMNCGNLRLGVTNAKINGNGHTMTFKKITGDEFVNVDADNLTVVSEMIDLTSAQKKMLSPCGEDIKKYYVFYNSTLSNVSIKGPGLVNIKVNDVVTFIQEYSSDSDRVGGSSTPNQIELLAGSTFNFSVKWPCAKAMLNDNSTLNIKDTGSCRSASVAIAGENTVVNMCISDKLAINDTPALYLNWGDGANFVCRNVTVNSNVDLTLKYIGLSSTQGGCLSSGAVTLNVVPNLCDQMNF